MITLMKKIFLFAAVVLTAMSAQAQEVPATGDTYMAAQLSTEDLNGTARFVGMGGAMDALGADISTMSTNPAGIGLFRKSYVSGSFGLNVQGDGKTFGDGSKTNASFDQIGFVAATRVGQLSYVNFGFNFHKSRNFDYVLSAANALKGSSQSNQTAFKDMNGLFINNKSLAYSQLDDIYMGNMTLIDDAVYTYEGHDYEFDRAHTGYIGEYDLNLSGNVNNRFYWGLTVGIHDVHYKGYSEYFERLNSENVPEVLITDNHKITGTGYSIKGGIIFRPVEASPFRIGVAVSSPTFYKLTTENHTHIGYGNYDRERNSASEDFSFRTPWKFSLSAGHTIGQNVALGAVYEYANYGTCDMRTIDGYYYDYRSDSRIEESSTDGVMKRHIEQSLKSVSTLKLGAEFKPDKNIAVRVGYNYISPIYNTSAMRDQTLNSPGVYYASTTDYTNWKETHRLTFGLGFTFDHFRFDMAYQYQTRKGDFYPFMKQYSASYYETDANGVETGNIITETNQCDPVSVKDNRHQLICTLGYTF